jgi:hypothetical protein
MLRWVWFKYTWVLAAGCKETEDYESKANMVEKLAVN